MDLTSKIAHFLLGNALGLCHLRGRHGAKGVGIDTQKGNRGS